MVLDWENAGPMAPGRELGAALLLWSHNGTEQSRAAVEAFVGGYVAATGKHDLGIEGITDFSVGFATLLNFLHAMASTAIADGADKQFAEAQVEMLLAAPLLELENSAASVLEMVLSIDI